MSARTTRLDDTLTIGAFVLALFVPAFLTWRADDEAISESENRALATRPQLEWSAAGLNAFPGRFDAYYGDQFALRAPLLPLYHRLRFERFGISPTDEVIVGEDGYLFLTEGTLEFEPLSEAQLANWAQELTRRRDLLAADGIEYVFVVVPDKTDIYPEFLPAYLARKKTASRIDRFCAEMERRTDVPVLNLSPVVAAAKGEDELYYRNDPHWNAFGAYLGCRALVERMAPWLPGVELPAWEHFAIEKRRFRGGGLARMMGLEDLLRERSYKLPRNEFAGCAKRFDITPPPEPSFGTECATGTGRVLMFRDSYATAMAPFLSETFARITYLWMRPSFADFRREVRAERPTVVIEERVSRFLNAEATSK